MKLDIPADEIKEISQCMQGFSGADVNSCLREALI